MDAPARAAAKTAADALAAAKKTAADAAAAAKSAK
uniref:Type I antifreeze protein n=1 Tax=Myoxocephalus brandtii TaxID=476918 RepID=A0A7S4ZCP4_9TELE|nr:type I antifreeze protein [Myoxocephalus brandtii]QCC29805.1 type I antifreeze protein [Myoxocephalus brandtii]QCC29807.1 type I antifreeze protein [Myoxocephalus brandtii]QCC29808.1 type I antifreeze protein [Myoxocephalus brandtii]QCC29809.1 type I antifreeze protein [Myoxocephalus brandtii]